MASQRYQQLNDATSYASATGSNRDKSFSSEAHLLHDAGPGIPKGRQSPRVPDWQIHPMPLDDMNAEKWAILIFDVILVILPLVFLGLAITIVRMDGTPESSYGYAVVQASVLGPTIWPIVFAAVVGLTLQRVALYNAEKGTTLGSLERLIGSQTMFSAVKTAAILQYYDYVALLLLALWALSPLGGQASVRALYLDVSTLQNNTEVSYQTSNTSCIMEQTATSSGDGFVTAQNLITTIYGAALFGADSGLQYSNGSSDGFNDLLQHLGGVESVLRSTTQDIWGNVRIPVLQLLPDFDPSNTNKWVSVPHREQIISYESLIGVPFRGLPMGGGNASFSINSTYFRFQCQSMYEVTWSAFLNHTAYSGDFQLHYLTHANQSTISQMLFSADGYGLAGFSLDTTMLGNGERIDQFFSPTDNATQFGPRDVWFISKDDVNIFLAKCDTTYHYVESQVVCTQITGSGLPSCAVDSMRSVKAANVQENLSPLELLGPVGNNTMTNFPKSGIHVHPFSSTPAEYFIADPPIAVSHSTFDPVNLTTLTPELFSNRFSLLFNTYWHATINPPLIVGRFLNYTYEPFVLDNPWANTTASLSSFTGPIYRVNKGWIFLMFLSACVTFFTGVVGLVIKYRTHVPDIFGYISSLTRDSPYLMAPGLSHASMLNGKERARYLKDVRVRFLHVEPEADMGRITLGIGEASAGVRQRKSFLPGRASALRGSSVGSVDVYHGT